MPYFKKLFEPINIGKMGVKNRIAMAPMASGFFSEEGLVTEQVKNYYEARAKGGAGLIIVESTSIEFPRGHSPNRAAIDRDLTLPGLTELAWAIKRHGARSAIQLYHPGRLGSSKITGFQPIGPSPIPMGELPKELTVDEIAEVVRLYARATAHAKEAGFEGIEVHAAHGYLLAQFLSPYSNQRQDRYGGSLENRARILVEVLKAIRDAKYRCFEPSFIKEVGNEVVE